jgi:hypothetical protein
VSRAIKMETRSSKRRRISQQTESVLASLLQLLVENDVLGAEDLESLSLVSKELHRTVSSDFLWKSVCHIHFPCTRTVPGEIVAKRGHRWLYWQWWRSKPFYDLPAEFRPPFGLVIDPMPQPSCKANDLVLYAHVKYRGECIGSFTIQDNDIASLVEQDGELCIPLSNPKILCPAEFHDCSFIDLDSFDKEAQSSYDGETRFALCTRNISIQDFTVTVHMFRSTDQTFCSILDTRGCCPGRVCCACPLVTKGSNVTVDSTVDAEKPTEKGSFCIKKGGPLALMESPLSDEIRTRLGSKTLHLEVSIHYDVVPSGHLAVTGLSLEAEEGFGCLPCFRLAHSPSESSNGATFLHVLSQLKARAI